MHKKIKTKQIDGYQIVVGIAPMIPDPHATHGHCETLVEAEPKAAEVREKKLAMEEKNRRAGQIVAQSRQLWTNLETMQRKTELTPAEKLVKDRLDADWNTVNVEINETQAELGALSVDLDIARRGHRRSNPVFNEPGLGEFIDRGLKVVGPDENGQPKIMSEAELEAAGYFLPGGQTVDEMTALWMACDENQKLCVDGSYVDDFRGKKYWYQDQSDKWISTEFPYLDNKPEAGEILDADLTPEQRAEIDAQNEAERVAGLTAEEKTAEYDAARAALLAQAGVMKTQLEVDNDPDPLGTSQAWFLAGEAELKTKYGVV
jgi:hypothetical protein